MASERDGRWGRAIEVPGLGALNTGGLVMNFSVSCASPGDCAVGGFHQGRHAHGFVAVERNGRWDKAIKVPGLAALNAGGSAGVASLSCPSPGRCAAGGWYTDRSRHTQGFAVTQAR